MVTASYIIRILLFLVLLPAESVGAREDDCKVHGCVTKTFQFELC